MWETQMEFLIPGLALAQILWTLSEVTRYTWDIFLSLFFLFISNSIQTKREVKYALGLKSRRKCPHECVCIHIYLDKVALDWNGSG